MTDSKEKTDAFDFSALSDVHTELQDDSSAPNVDAIAAQTAKTIEAEQAKPEAQTGGQTDSEGTVFDPALHATNKDGEPSKTPTGKWRRKRGTGRASSVVAQENQAVIDLQRKREQEANARAAAHAAVDMTAQSLQLLLGPEWEPVQDTAKGIDERQQLKDATANYFIAKEINDFPPGVALAVVVFSYAMPRFVGGEETKSKMTRAKLWLATKFENMRRKRKNVTQPDRGNDGKREDNAGEETVRDEPQSGTRHSRS